MGGGKGGGGGTTTVEKADPWVGQQPYLRDLFSRAQTLSQQPMQTYPGSTVAGFTGPQLQGQQMALDAANAMGPQIQSAQGASQFGTSGAVLSPDSNPYLAQHAQAATRPIQEQLVEEVIPGIESQAVAQGAYSSNRPGVSKAMATGRAADAMGDVTTDIYSNAYGQGLDYMGKSLALAPQTMQLGTMPSQIYQGVGSQQQQMDQAQLTDLVNKFEQQQMEPWDRLSQYGSLVGGGNYGGTSNRQVDRATNQALSTLGGGATGAWMGSMVPGWGAGAGSMLGPAGWAGMGLGALLGYMA